jgi:hypothetical protein
VDYADRYAAFESLLLRKRNMASSQRSLGIKIFSVDNPCFLFNNYAGNPNANETIIKKQVCDNN